MEKQSPDTSPRAALYLRVSSDRQALNELSIPDQRKTLEAHCARKGWVIADVYEESGSAFHGSRRKFDLMIERARSGERRYDVIAVHSFSRFFRDATQAELVIRDLRKVGVKLVSITQDFGEDESADLFRKIIMAFDEHNSKETGKHFARSMRENAKQGFGNGGPMPFGIETFVAERRGETRKKKLRIAAVEASTIKKMYDLFEAGDGVSGPMGMKKNASWLNENGYKNRNIQWTTGKVHRVMTDPVITGRYVHGRGGDASQAVVVPVPEIISERRFNSVQRTLKSRNPKKTPLRDTTSDVLLSKVARCGKCGAGMTISTGKGRKYRYYKCSAFMQKGKAACSGTIVPMDAFDDLVIEHVCSKVVTPERMTDVLAQLPKRQGEKSTP